MILGTKRHGRTRRDTANLIAHLEKATGQTVELVAIDNSPGETLREALRGMEILRDGSRAEIAFHHLHISPRHALTPDQRNTAVARILHALGAEDHAWALVRHSEKGRASAGGADEHYHLVLAHVGNDLRALDMSQSYARLEAVARSLEADWGEELTPTRRHEAVASAARLQGRDDVADSVMAQRPVDPADLPRAAMSSDTRQRAERAGLNLPELKAAVAAAYGLSDGPQAFRAALTEKGLTLVQGERQGVWMVMSGETAVGALDRLVKGKRRDVAAWIETEVRHGRDAEARRGDPDHDQARGAGRDGREEGPRSDPWGGDSNPRPDPAERGGRGGGEPRPRDAGAGSAGVAPSGADAGRAEPPSGQDRAALAHAAVIVANAQPKARQLLELARQIAHEADPDFHAARRLEARLDRLEEKSRQRLQDASQRPEEPSRVGEARQQAEDAHRAARRALRAEQEAEARVDELREAQPRGIVAWLTGKTAQHRQEIDRAVAARAAAKTERQRLDVTDSVMASVGRSVERKWIEERDAIEAKQRHEREEARRALQWAADARSVLRSDPTLANDEKALEEAVEALQEQRRQQELEERRRQDYQPDPGSTFRPR
jgi:hypothetical protein